MFFQNWNLKAWKLEEGYERGMDAIYSSLCTSLDNNHYENLESVYCLVDYMNDKVGI